jgi:hypothetical protein
MAANGWVFVIAADLTAQIYQTMMKLKNKSPTTI